MCGCQSEVGQLEVTLRLILVDRFTGLLSSCPNQWESRKHEDENKDRQRDLGVHGRCKLTACLTSAPWSAD